MPSTSSSTRLDRKALKKPDALTKSLRGFFDRLSKRSRELAIAGGVLVALAAAAALYLQYRDSRAFEAAGSLFEARQAQQKELKALALKEPKKEAPKSAKGDAKKSDPAEDSGEPTADQMVAASRRSLVVAEAYPTASKLLAQVSERYSGTRAAFEAEGFLADLYFNHGHMSDAETWFGKAAANAPTSLERSLALMGLGVAQENQKKYKEALQTYQGGINAGQAALKGEFLMAKGRCHEALQEKQQARDTYQRIRDELKSTGYARAAEARLAELGT
ncbi:MAG: tetratricopeptide repeat protein [Bdellovibrionales bacterium]|nr:tetratricopeptide repeat protein [Bdellovibrionales bacterium]